MRYFVLGFCLSYLLVLLASAYSDGFFQKRIEQPVEAIKFISRYFQEPELNKWWYPVENTKNKGVVTYDQSNSWGDYTLFTITGTDKAFIVDMTGKVIHEWNIVFPDKKLTYKDRATAVRVFSDPEDRGNIYAFFFGEKNFVSHYGMIKYDYNSNVLWDNFNALHHDLTSLGNNEYMTFLQVAREDRHPALPHIDPPFLDEYLIILDSTAGKITKRISLFEAFAQSEYAPVLESLHRSPADPYSRDGDLLHPNTITRVPEHVANAHPNITDNSVMLSFRNISMLAFLDLETETITWAFYGPWRAQHDAKFLENGNVIMFDNQGHTGPGGYSRLLEVNLKDLGIVWEYTGTKENPFYSIYNGMIEVLPNENIIVTESHSGRIFEITRDKEIVWDYYVEDRIAHNGEIRIPSVVSAQRFTREELTSLFIK